MTLDEAVTAQDTDGMHQTSDLMRATRYSQLPMLKGYIPVDSISERRIFEPLIQGSTID